MDNGVRHSRRVADAFRLLRGSGGKMTRASILVLGTSLLAVSTSWAQSVDGPSTAINGADTAWVLLSSALVLAMLVPGLALFYGGLVRSKNVLGTIMQSFAILCL